MKKLTTYIFFILQATIGRAVCFFRGGHRIYWLGTRSKNAFKINCVTCGRHQWVDQSRMGKGARVQMVNRREIVMYRKRKLRYV